jgi:hypothetical protein
MMDAVAAVQRHSPRFMISEPRPCADWVHSGALYLCRKPRTVADVEGLSKDPERADACWAGVICFRGTPNTRQLLVPWVATGGDRCLDYGDFAVFGDRDLLREVRAILANEGFEPVRGH